MCVLVLEEEIAVQEKDELLYNALKINLDLFAFFQAQCAWQLSVFLLTLASSR